MKPTLSDTAPDAAATSDAAASANDEKEALNLRAASLEELGELFDGLAEPRYRAQQLFRRLHHHLAESWDDLHELPKSLRQTLEERARLPALRIADRAVDEGGTCKLLFHLDTAARPAASVEAVWIPSATRRTVCVSSQAGCSLDCSFCATGTLEFSGNLEAWQIVEQVYALARIYRERVSNVVFMGMGEPLHNYDAVIAAAHRLHDENGLHIGARRLTISTAGVLPGIERYVDERQPFTLAISLNHSSDQGRSAIMAINERYPLVDLLTAARRYVRELRRPITFEYVMIPGVNMSAADARRLIGISRSVDCKLNVIPLNTTLRGWRRPEEREVADFVGRLREGGVRVFNRGSPGRRIAGACGMLAAQAQPGAS